MKKKNNIIKKIFLIIIVIIIASSLALVAWAQSPYLAQDIALETMNSSDNISYTDNYTIIKANENADTALIFYPGADVEAIAYLPLLKTIQENSNITCIIVEMPLNLAFLGINEADKVMQLEELSNIENWYISGHSLGSAMASVYAQDNDEKVEGLIVLGGYVYGEYDKEKSLTIYGTFNSELEKYMDYEENIMIIEGGNHAQFGNYGKQKGDPDATITPDEQQKITAQLIDEFIF